MTKRKRKIPRIRLAGDPILTTVCYPVGDGEKIYHIICDMKKVVNGIDGCVGISANQVGYSRRIITIKTGDNTTLTMINPIIKGVSEEEGSFTEACLSHPGKEKDISRPIGIVLDYQTIEGTLVIDQRIEGFAARVIQHEIDHLNGKCLVGELI